MNATRNNHLIGKFLYLLLFVSLISGCISSPSDFNKATPNTSSSKTGIASIISTHSGNSQSVIAGNSLSSNLVTIVKDLNNNPVSGVTVDWSTTAGTLGAASSTTDANGLASNSLNPGTVAGTKTITATIQGSATSTTFTVTVQPAGVSASTSTIAALPFSLSAGSTATVTMTLKDQYGNAIPNQAASFVSTGTTNTIVQLVSDTDSNGQVTGTISSTLAEVKTISFGLPVALSGVSSTLTYNPDSVSNFALSGIAASVTAGASNSLTVTAKDDYANTVTNYTGTIQFASNDAQAVLPANYAFQASDNGVHIFAGLVLKTAGDKSVTAADAVTNSITGSQSGITVGPAVADHLVKIAGDNQTGTVSANVSINPKVQVVDAFGNAVAGASISFIASAGASVGSSLVTSDVDGYASTTFQLSSTAGANTLTASGQTSLPGLAGSSSVVFNETGISGVNTLSAANNNQTVKAGGTFYLPLIATARNASNAPISGVTIEWSTTYGGTFSSSTSVTGANGQATVYYTPSTTKGTKIVTATVQGTSKTANFSLLQVIPDTPTYLNIISGNNQSAIVNQELPMPLTVEVGPDIYGNTYNNYVISWETDQGALSSSNSVTDSSSRSSVVFTTPPTNGTSNIKVTIPGTSLQALFQAEAAGAICNSTSSNGVINPKVNVSRIKGVAPLSVFFDATETTSTNSTYPFHELDYSWNFGDVGAGVWNYGAKPGISSKNTAKGAYSAHLYETPGTYTVNLSITDGTNTASNNCIEITVEDPDTVYSGAKTKCFTQGATSAGICPGGGTEILNASSDVTSLINTNLAQGKRLLFARNQTWSTTATTQLKVNGPWTIGAYGVGAKPIFLRSAGSSILAFGDNGKSFTDARVMDLQLKDDKTHSVTAVSGIGSFDKITLLRLDIINTLNGFNMSTSAPQLLKVWENVMIVDSTVFDLQSSSGGNACFLTYSKSAVLGNSFDNNGGAEHNYRMMYFYKLILSNNKFARPLPTKANITLRAPTFQLQAGPLPAGTYSDYAIISDNEAIGAAGVNQPINTSVDGAYDARTRNIIFERNWIHNQIGGGNPVRFNSSYSTIRNNIFDLSASTSAGDTAIDIRNNNGASSLTPNPSNNWIYNNTIYSNKAYSGFTDRVVAVNVYNDAENTTVKNNLLFAPNAVTAGTNVATVNNAGTGTIGSSGTLGNSSNAQAISGMMFNNINNPASPEEFKPISGYAIGNGVTVNGLVSDFFNQLYGANTSGAIAD